MPELPEVETVARYLKPALLNRRLLGVQLAWKRMLVTPSYRQFYKLCPGSLIKDVSRRGKFLVFQLESVEGPRHLLIHLRMSGALQVFKQNIPQQKHDRAIFDLDDGMQLRFNDVRKFGRIYLVEKAEEAWGDLGPEPFDQSLNVSAFTLRLANRSGALKPLLLNQSFLAGLGNIYADEALWRAGLHPLKQANRLTSAQIKKLLLAIRSTLKSALNSKGTDIGDNVVEFGNYRPKVYQRDGLPCPKCKVKIKRIVVGQRGTHFCPTCQK